MYGQEIIKKLSKRLSAEYGKGFERANLYRFVQFYNTYPNIFASPMRQSLLSWTHYLILLTVISDRARKWHEEEAIKGSWSIRPLQRNANTNIAKYSILNGNEQLFATKYKLCLPSEEELKREIENQKLMFHLQHKEK